MPGYPAIRTFLVLTEIGAADEWNKQAAACAPGLRRSPLPLIGLGFLDAPAFLVPFLRLGRRWRFSLREAND